MLAGRSIHWPLKIVFRYAQRSRNVPQQVNMFHNNSNLIFTPSHMFLNTEINHQVAAAGVLKTTFAYLLLWMLVFTKVVYRRQMYHLSLSELCLRAYRSLREQRVYYVFRRF